jgi:hypothetical protein
MDQRVLTIGIDHENPLPFFVEGRAEVHGDRALPDSALLLSYRDDFRCQFIHSLTGRGILP